MGSICQHTEKSGAHSHLEQSPPHLSSAFLTGDGRSAHVAACACLMTPACHKETSRSSVIPTEEPRPPSRLRANCGESHCLPMPPRPPCEMVVRPSLAPPAQGCRRRARQRDGWGMETTLSMLISQEVGVRPPEPDPHPRWSCSRGQRGRGFNPAVPPTPASSCLPAATQQVNNNPLQFLIF